MTTTDAMLPNAEQRKMNRRTAWVLATIAAAFFLGVIARHWLFGG